MAETPEQTKAAADARARLDSLAKPVGSLGLLEDLVVQLCRAQASYPPILESPKVLIFAGDHGVARDEGVSPFPQAVTISMLKTMYAGKSCATSFSKSNGATVDLIDVGVANEYSLEDTPHDEIVRFFNDRVCEGTDNLAVQPAMSAEQMKAALQVGRDAVDRAIEEDGTRIFAIGEMGIGNTTPASAIASRLLGFEDPTRLVGPGTGLDEKGMQNKSKVIAKALARGGSSPEDALGVLQDLGGLEIAAMTGAYLQGPEREIALLVDGIISSSAALVAVRHDPRVASHLIFATRSSEPGQKFMLEEVQSIAGATVIPVLDLSLHLGEASGAALALPILRAGANLLKDGATLAEVMAMS
mmetsp:Transcript_9207/g.18108  ORF Transcript_9207/g.18108 Transcript_9207/m.18108 type:complete len:358 (+) Transcript_9207:482-1555(+)|eukprot:CAMPEP_0171548488 /NCGR_PEP_ID=MMETSP0960-20121227/5864_1 /TAXON_ID=87120 /ORGANISM="Aurantiochytrium limacinum, Strain ATCCMYA-1381" /LENGTH=357 /DNA_ID=CAMNT_0012096973 /DNA_START=424 /DNA_END=1497 /DNA_ORIENTATION=-